MGRDKNLFDPASPKPFKLSRSRLENFIKCPRCFYLDRRLGIDRPSMPGFTLNSAVDDLWVTPANQLIVVDYKATSKDGEVSLDDDWKDSYKRQMEIYQWILRGMGYDVQDTGYFVYANGRKDRDGFNGTLSFHIQLISYTGNCSWVEKAVKDAWECLSSDKMPECQDGCEHCAYRSLARALEA